MSSRRMVKGLTLWAVDRPEIPIAAVLSYQVSDPLAVHLALMQNGRDSSEREASKFVFARALLEAGLSGPCGEGNVRVAPHEADGWLVITLQPAKRPRLAVYADRAQIVKILSKSYRLVARGCERVDVEGCVQRILGEVIL
jgi:hypothetical protein